MRSDGLRQLADRNLPCLNLEDAPSPMHIATTDTGRTVVLSKGSAAQAIIASADSGGLRPGAAWRSLSCRWRRIEQHGSQGGGSTRCTAPNRSTHRLACALDNLPVGAVANALHALTLLVARQCGATGRQHRFFRPAAALPAGGVPARLLPDKRSDRDGRNQHRGWDRRGRSRPTGCPRAARHARKSKPGACPISTQQKTGTGQTHFSTTESIVFGRNDT